MKQYTRITVLSQYRETGVKDKMASCICHCGKHFAASYSKVKLGQTRSCGCQGPAATIRRLTTHGLRNTREYKSWCAMKARCCNSDDAAFPDYGGRGITVCARWIESAENFVADMGPCPDGFTIERNDVNGNYEPSNCRWASKKEQTRNKRNSIMVEYLGETKNLADVAELSGVPYERLRYRIERGMSADEAARLYQPI
ncbi:hypothetical protein [Massilia sp.]|uniref:hypothetical protein n=1 Tax=Massilia sp. TaxID=1882437 RepID=UPI00352CE681